VGPRVRTRAHVLPTLPTSTPIAACRPTA
jgi:hypothetical protein